MTKALKAPFPWFGGKSRVAPIVWQAFGDVPNYVEPFFGSGAVLLGRPHAPGVETVNDKDGFVANFWRALQAAPDEVERHADNPVNENDLHARHVWLVERRADLVARLEGDPDFYDAKIAGWWVWGISAWIGSGFCSGDGPWRAVVGSDGARRLVKTDSAGMGVKRQRAHLDGAGLQELASRLRRVRVCCGDWSRVCGPSVTIYNGVTGVFFDPPYGGDAGRCNDIYATEDLTVAHECLRWCIENGDNKALRIALCGYEGEHDTLESHGWRVVAWKAKGGYGSQGDGSGRANAGRERIWFSPHCLRPSDGLFDFLDLEDTPCR